MIAHTQKASLWRLSVAGIALLSVACRGRSTATRAESGAADSGSAISQAAVRLERGPCRGFCPEYTVELFDDGTVRFDGRRNVQMSGAQQSRIPAAAVKALRESIASSVFATADTAYVYESAGCGRYATDIPVNVLTVRLASSHKSVRRDGGCQGAPAALAALEARVDSVANTRQWISKDGGTTR